MSICLSRTSNNVKTIKHSYLFLSRVNENRNVKISDFGLARDVYSCSYYRQTQDVRVPVKWMALESLHDRVYCTETDVVIIFFVQTT